MSNQSVNGFQGSQPFITDKQFQNLSLDEIKHIIEQEKEALKKDYSELEQRKRLIKQYKKLVEARNKVKQGIDIKKKYKKKKLSTKNKDPFKTIIKKKKTFKDYFEECIKNKKIPEDTPSYLKKALEKAMLEYEQELEKEKSSLFGFTKEKSSLYGFANKYVIEGIPGVIPLTFFKLINENLIGFFTYHRNIKFRLVLVCMMEKKAVEDKDELNIDENASYIPLPEWIKNKKAIVNIKNKDDKCFLWCILRYLYPKERDEERIKDLEKYEFSLNTKGITFPMNINNINKFEKLNPSLPGINVFSVDDKNTIYPLREAKRDCKNTIDLFLHEEDGVSHYSLIKNFHRLIRKQKTKSLNGKIFICKRCFSHYTKEELLDKHIKYCSNNATAVVKMPEPNTMLYFKNYHKQLPIPFVVYADFECFTKPMNSCSPNPKESYNYNYQKHEPSGFCFYVDKKIKPIIYTKKSEDEDVAKIFVEKLTEVTKSLRTKPLRLTSSEQKSFEEANTCHICNCDLGEDKVRDHCHFTGQYRGAAHNKCNLMCKKPKVLPVIFHNLQGYDAHLFIKQLARLEGKLDCIPSTEEKYISFSKTIKVGEYKDCSGSVFPVKFEIRFLDSFKFIQTSLSNLVSNLSPDDFINTKQIFKKNTELLTRKGVYPYDYVSSFKKLSETQLPPKEKFYSQLNDEEISDDDYQHAINVWNTFDCKTIRDYHNLYLKTDVLLLADVFENFRKTCLKHYKLDPAHYYTSPGLAWDACLKETGQHLELLHDYGKL